MDLCDWGQHCYWKNENANILIHTFSKRGHVEICVCLERFSVATEVIFVYHPNRQSDTVLSKTPFNYEQKTYHGSSRLFINIYLSKYILDQYN